MVDRARLLLDKLLGQERDQLEITNIADMCIFSMAGLCPYETFLNTKMNLGNCTYKIHASKKNLCKREYEYELFRFLLEINNYIRTLVNESTDKNEEIIMRERLLNTKIHQTRELGLSGSVKQALSLLNSLKPEILELNRIKENFYVNNKNKNMSRCHLCGITVITNFDSHNYMTHINGKLHNGVISVNNKLGELINKFGEEEMLKIVNNKNLKYLKKFESPKDEKKF